MFWADQNEILVAVFFDNSGDVRIDLFQTSDLNNYIFEISIKNLNYDLV